MRRYAVLLPLALLLLAATSAGATWSAAAGGAPTAGARSMVNVPSFDAACTVKGKANTVTLTWTASPDPLVDAYEIVRTGSGGGPSAVLMAAGTLSSLQDEPPTTPGAGYTYAIRSASTTIAWKSTLRASITSVTYDAKGKCFTV